MFNTDAMLPPDYPPSVVGRIGRSGAGGVENQLYFLPTFPRFGLSQAGIKDPRDSFPVLIGSGEFWGSQRALPKG